MDPKANPATETNSPVEPTPATNTPVAAVAADATKVADAAENTEHKNRVQAFLADHAQMFKKGMYKAHDESVKLAKDFEKTVDVRSKELANTFVNKRLENTKDGHYKWSLTTGLLVKNHLVPAENVEEDPAHKNHFRLKK